MAQLVKNLLAMWETWVQSLGWEDPLEKEMATHSSTLAWKIPWMEEHGRLQSMGSQRVGRTRLHFHFHFIVLYGCKVLVSRIHVLTHFLLSLSIVIETCLLIDRT